MIPAKLGTKLGKIDLKQELDEELQELLDEMGVYLEDLVEVPGEKLHSFMISHTAYVDENGDRLIFFGVDQSARNKFLYYMGAENEAELTTLWKGIAIYEGISESRLDRFRS